MRISLPDSNFAQVSSLDEDLVSLSWRNYNGYAGHRVKRIDNNRMLYMHRVVLERQLGRNLMRSETVDHKNGDKLDNRRNNLRLATRSQNGQNVRRAPKGASKFVGVVKCEHWTHEAWAPRTRVKGQVVSLGCYASEEEAAWMRDQLVLGLYPGFAITNFKYN